MSVSSSFILVTFCACILCTSNAACPPGAPAGCECSNSRYGKTVECDCTKLVQPLTNIPSWIENDTQTLSLTKCNIRNITNDSIKNLKSLTRIDLQKQQSGLSVNDSSIFQGLKKLTYVNLAGNSISFLPRALFANLPNLNAFSLDDNPLNTLPDDLFQNSPNISIFSVAKTQLYKDILAKVGEGKFGKNIRSLYMYETRIADLKAGFFSGLPNLENLGIHDCEISYIRADVLKGTKVKVAKFTGNPVKNIDVNAFAGDTLLDFKCENCKLTSAVAFNGFIKKVRSLKSLFLKNNLLTNIPKNAFTGLKDLGWIDLSNNTIMTIEKNPFANLKVCSADPGCINLQDNPLNCDCKLAWFKDWAKKWDNLENLKCQTPSNVSGKDFTKLLMSQFCCLNETDTKCGSVNYKTTDPVTVSQPSDCATSFSAGIAILITGTFCMLEVL